ncbi:MAG: hypothetical protein ACLRIS_04970 [Flavonifractor plautii]
MLASYGITPEAMGCEIRSSMEVVELGTSDTGLPVYLDKNAYEADGIIVSCRLKPHNAFRGPYESGPCKMLAVGLGKQKGPSGSTPTAWARSGPTSLHRQGHSGQGPHPLCPALHRERL